MKEITIVSLGIDGPGALTADARAALLNAEHLVLRTKKHRVIELLNETGKAYQSLDACYDAAEDFDALNEQLASAVEEKAKRYAVVYAVFDATEDESVRLLRARFQGKIREIPGMPLYARMLPYVSAPYLIIPAAALHPTSSQYPVLITELDSRLLAGECKLKLIPWYGEDCRVLYFDGNRSAPFEITLDALDRQKSYGHQAMATVFPPSLLEKKRFDVEDLLHLMRILRGRDGCPWDRKQTHLSLRKYLIEEAYEAVYALTEEDWEHAADELGDVLLQIALHSAIGEEYATFDFTDICTLVCKKMIHRHPHVFASKTADITSEQVVSNWQEIKQKERSQMRLSDQMLETKRGLPPAIRAAKIQTLAKEVHFDWKNAEDALEKVIEETEELKQELRTGADPRPEAGDLAFSVINVLRLMNTDLDEVLNLATEKFVKRFIQMEKFVEEAGKTLKCLTDEEFCVYWERSKAAMNE